MEILILIAIPAVLAWILVFLDRQERTKANLLPTLGLLVLIIGQRIWPRILSSLRRPNSNYAGSVVSGRIRRAIWSDVATGIRKFEIHSTVLT